VGDGSQVHWYELGEGDPVALLHGGLERGEDWRDVAKALSADHRVVVPDRRGHGGTPDAGGAYTYPGMADETTAFLSDHVDGPAHLVGYSDGGIVALHVALKDPELVRSLVLIGTNFHVDGLLPAMRERLEHPDPDNPRLAGMRDVYGRTSPDGPDHWPVFYRKVCELGSTGPTLSVDDLGRIARPALVIAGDDDVIDHHHTVELFESLPDARLAIVPGTSHLLPHEAPDALLALVQPFLAGEPAHRLMPMRTAR
jgi:pimeloyl-ACP methyl ester carboxylesterase